MTSLYNYFDVPPGGVDMTSLYNDFHVPQEELI